MRRDKRDVGESSPIVKCAAVVLHKNLTLLGLKANMISRYFVVFVRPHF